MQRYKIFWVPFTDERKYLGTVHAACEASARNAGRRQFGPFGNGQEIEAEAVR